MLIMILSLKSEAEAILSLRPTLSVSEQYDDNLFFSGSDPEADFTSMILPGVELSVTRPNSTFSGRYEATGEFHARHPEENRWAHTLSFDASFPVLSNWTKGARLQLREALAYTPERSPFAFGDKNGEVQESFPTPEAEGVNSGRTDSLLNSTAVSLSYDRSARFLSKVSYSYSLTRFKDPRLQDFDVQDLSLEESFRWSSQIQTTLSYGLSLTNYEGAEQVTAHRATAGGNHQLARGTSVGGEGGVTVLAGGEVHLLLNVHLSRSLKTGSLSFRYNHGIGTGGGLTSNATLSDQVTAQATQILRPNLSIEGQFGYGRNRSLSGPGLKISTYNAGGGIQIGFLSWLTGRIHYSYTNQKVQGGEGVEAERNRIVATLTAVPSMIRFQ
jgi:hypothetical protein